MTNFKSKFVLDVNILLDFLKMHPFLYNIL